MAQNVTIAGAAYSSVPAINLNKTGGGTAIYVDTTDADATAKDITKGKTAYVGGSKIMGTNTGGITPTGMVTITQAGDTDVTNYATAHVNSGSISTPTASKSGVSNHSITVTPSVESTAGYIGGGSKSGAPVTVSASELVSGSETKTSNGTYDVTNLSQLVVNIPTFEWSVS